MSHNKSLIAHLSGLRFKSNRTTLKLSVQVLELHQGIRTVLITRLEDGEWKLVEEAIRPGVTLLEKSREDARAQLAMVPGLLIGAADAIKGRAGELEIVAVLYQKVGAVFTALDSTVGRILCITTERDALEEVMLVIRKALTKLKEESLKSSSGGI